MASHEYEQLQLENAKRMTAEWVQKAKEESKMISEDFGFTFSDGSDLHEVVQTTAEAAKAIEDARAKMKSRHDALETVLTMVNSFLTNLQKEPEKKYLLWPDRAAKVKAFQDKLNHTAN